MADPTRLDKGEIVRLPPASGGGWLVSAFAATSLLACSFLARALASRELLVVAALQSFPAMQAVALQCGPPWLAETMQRATTPARCRGEPAQQARRRVTLSPAPKPVRCHEADCPSRNQSSPSIRSRAFWPRLALLVPSWPSWPTPSLARAAFHQMHPRGCPLYCGAKQVEDHHPPTVNLPTARAGHPEAADGPPKETTRVTIPRASPGP